jgi:hypothetical protein
MRALLIFAIFACSAALVAGCIPDERKELEWQKPPKAWDPKGDSLTLGAKGLEAFNRLNPEDRTGQVAEWIGSPGSFKGQAVYKMGAGVGKAMDDSDYGTYEIFAMIPDPVLYEITITYRLYTTPEVGKGLPPHAYIEFTGTLVEMDFQADDKPRKMEVKVQLDKRPTVLQD